MKVVYFDKRGKERVYYDPNKSAPYGFVIDDSNHSIRLYMKLPNKGSDTSETYFRFNDEKIDVFKTQFSININRKASDLDFYGGTSIVREKIWFNNVLIWERQQQEIAKIPMITKYLL